MDDWEKIKKKGGFAMSNYTMGYKKLLWLITFFWLTSCNSPKPETSKTDKLANTYCGSCHLVPDPSLLDKKAWLEKVLPPMGKMLGIEYYWGEPINSSKGGLSLQDWKRIVQDYVDLAPDTMAGQNRAPVKDFSNLFSAESVDVVPGKFPATSYVKIDPGNHFIYQGDAFDSTLNIYNEHLRKLATHNIHSVLVDMNFADSLAVAGDRRVIATDIGMMNPNDAKKGKAYSFLLTKNGSLTNLKKIIDSLPRPVQTIATDLDRDGKDDWLVCGFGNRIGDLYWIKNSLDGKIEKQILRALPGAVKAYVDDFNHDGLLDIMVLMAQAQEGIYLLINNGNGSFETKEVLRFPPIYGSSYFELDDFNGDGFKDILYTCGDNGDYTWQTLKNYHGVYIFLNDGKNNFHQKYFYPIHGCYKAIARDFDKDGDLDIAAISYFPDEVNQPQESFHTGDLFYFISTYYKKIAKHSFPM